MNRGVSYNFKTGESTELTLNVENIQASRMDYSGQNYVSINNIMYIISPESKEIITFDMINRVYNSTKNISEIPDVGDGNINNQYALCTDGSQYLFIISENKMYMVSLNDLSIIDLRESTADYGIPLLNQQRGLHACNYINGIVYVLSGYSNNNPLETNTVWEKCTINLGNKNSMIFSSVGQTFNGVTSPSYFYGSRTVTIQDNIYIFAGATTFDGTNFIGGTQVYIYNPGTNQVTNGGNIQQGRLLHHAILRDQYEGKVYVLGGLIRTFSNSEPSADPFALNSIEESIESVVTPTGCGNPMNSCFGISTESSPLSSTINTVNIRLWSDNIGAWIDYNDVSSYDPNCVYFKNGFTDWFDGIFFTCISNIKAIGIQSIGNDDWIIANISYDGLVIDTFNPPINDNLVFNSTNNYYVIDLNGTIISTDVNYSFLTVMPTLSPSVTPTNGPTVTPTNTPSVSPTDSPSTSPTHWPTSPPTAPPSMTPTSSPSTSPTLFPSTSPTQDPSTSPTISPTLSPSGTPTNSPSISPINEPTSSPTIETSIPTTNPTVAPTMSPTTNPSTSPTNEPTTSPVKSPTSAPTIETSIPTSNPSSTPSVSPSTAPSTTPTSSPSTTPTLTPTTSPSQPPTKAPTGSPSATPTNNPNIKITLPPSMTPTKQPTLANPVPTVFVDIQFISVIPNEGNNCTFDNPCFINNGDPYGKLILEQTIIIYGNSILEIDVNSIEWVYFDPQNSPITIDETIYDVTILNSLLAQNIEQGTTTFKSILTINSLRTLTSNLCPDTSKPQFFVVPGNAYGFATKITSNANQIRISEFQYIQSRIPPYNGNCYIDDPTNKVLFDPFSIICDNWIGNGLEYTYLAGNVLINSLQGIVSTNEQEYTVIIRDENNIVSCFDIPPQRFPSLSELVNNNIITVDEVKLKLDNVTNNVALIDDPSTVKLIFDVINELYMNDTSELEYVSTTLVDTTKNIVSSAMNISLKTYNSTQDIKDQISKELGLLSELTTNNEIINAQAMSSLVIEEYMNNLVDQIEDLIIAGQISEELEDVALLSLFVTTNIDSAFEIDTLSSFSNSTELNNLQEAVGALYSILTSVALTNQPIGSRFEYKHTINLSESNPYIFGMYIKYIMSFVNIETRFYIFAYTNRNCR